MVACAYCSKEEKLTKEHLVPSWYIRENIAPADKSFFLERVGSKFISSDPQVKDVCATCNNVKLGALDDYGKYVYNSLFCVDYFDGEKVKISVEHEKFVRWLLKISYNCARIHSNDVDLLGEYSKQMIGEEPLSKDVIVFSMMVSPTFFDQGGPRMAHRSERDSSILPRWFRIGSFRIPDSNLFDWVFRHVLINGYCFFLAIPRKGLTLKEDRKSILASMRQKGYGVLLSNGEALIKRPRRHTAEFFASHMEQFPTAYDLPEHGYISDIVKSNYKLIIFHIEKSEIESRDISRVVEYIDSLLRTRESVMACAGKVEFAIRGYDDTSHALWTMPDVREYLRLLNDARPYWFFFQTIHGDWLKALTFCLMDVRQTGNGTELLVPEQFSSLLVQWFDGLNRLCNQFALSTEINQKFSERAGNFINMFVDRSGANK
ncbi:hypothetical protein [Pseudomonas sp. GW456-L15]|uniref:hypothetical protein n=1 Tax=Pseudomonas sp. GW456-L15 TaxID=2751353 RepID=UPI001A90F874|nr:hypothetical protein [Pseudomonas sp. GW456-L15]